VTEPTPDLPTAEQFWAMEDAWVAGRVFYDRIPSHRFPAWASRILRIVWSRCLDLPPAFEQLVRLLMESQDWSQGKQLYGAVQEFTLQLEALPTRTPDQELGLRVCYLAESIAKTAYNRANPPDPFGDDAGHWIPGCLKAVVEKIPDESFRSLAWSGLLG
jgi:hypothetical protein